MHTHTLLFGKKNILIGTHCKARMKVNLKTFLQKMVLLFASPSLNFLNSYNGKYHYNTFISGN